MIVETRAVGPFFKNGFIVGCETTRDAVIIDPGDEVSDLLKVGGREKLAIRHILLTHAHVDHVTGVAAAKRATAAPVHLHRDDVFLYEQADRDGRDVRLARRASTANRRVLRPRAENCLRRVRGHVASHAGTLPWRRVPADWKDGNRWRAISSSATRCSQDRSVARICRAASHRCCSRRFGTSSSRSATMRLSIQAMARRRPSGGRRRTNPFLTGAQG